MLFFLGASLLLTLPVARHPASALPSDLTDTLLNTWILAWDAQRAPHALAGVWNAPIFYPLHDTLAFSENLFGVAALAAPVYWLTGNPIAAYNAAFVISFAIAGIGMFLLAHELTGRRVPAAIAGLAFAFGPLRLAQIAHLQMVATGWIPITLWGLHRYFATRRARWLAAFAAAWTMQIVSNSYAGYFVALPVVAVVVDGLARARETRRRDAVNLVVAMGLMAIALAPVATAYVRARREYRQVRSIDEIAERAADVRSYVVGKNTVGVWRWLPTMVSTDPERELFPGVFVVAIAAAAFVLVRRPRDERRWVILYAGIAMAAFVVSLGPHVKAWGHLLVAHGPYEWLLRVVPGMDGMRVPARMAIVFVAALSVLAAFGAAWVLDRVTPGRRGIAAALLAAMVVADGWSVPLPMLPYAARGRLGDRAVADWLRASAPGPVIHLPITDRPEVELHHQYVTLFHGNQIANGTSGYSAPLQDFLRAPRSPLHEPETLAGIGDFLSGLGIRYVAVHPDDFASPAEAAAVVDALRASTRLARAAALPGVDVFELAQTHPPSPSATSTPLDPRAMTITASEAVDRLPFLVDGDRDTRWLAGLGGQDGSGWLAIALAPTDIARVDLQFAERSWHDYPRRLRIESTDARGAVRTLYDAAPLFELGVAMLGDPRYPTLRIVLPPNATATLTIRQTATIGSGWSVHELRLWGR